MGKDHELRHAYGEQGEVAASLSLAGLERLSKRARDLQSEIGELIDWSGGVE